MEVGGVDLGSIELDNSDFVLPDVVPGRYLNGDGDIYAYNCSGNDDTSREEVINNLEREVRNKMQLAGADHYHLQITADGSCKGNRHNFACVKEYQGNRADKPKPKNLAFARNYILQSMNSTPNHDQEADDGLAQFQQRYIDRGEEHLCVLDSADKDLRMCGGLHLDPDNGAIVEVSGYGSCEWNAEKNKVQGWGHSFFWHQVLMGDGADAIPGLPDFGKYITKELWPTAPLIEARRRCIEKTMPKGKALTEKQLKAAEAKVRKLTDEVKPKTAGAKGVYEYLEGINNNQDAYAAVMEAYEGHYGTGKFDFTDWRGRTFQRDAYAMMMEQAVLLWMRRYHTVTDVADFMTEVRNGAV